MAPAMKGKQRGGSTGQSKKNKQAMERRPRQEVAPDGKKPMASNSGTEDDFYDPHSCPSSCSSSSSAPPPASSPPFTPTGGPGGAVEVRDIVHGLQSIELPREGVSGEGETGLSFADASPLPSSLAVGRKDGEEEEEAEFAEFVEAPTVSMPVPVSLTQQPPSRLANPMVGKSREEVLTILWEQTKMLQIQPVGKKELSKLVAKYRGESERLLFIRPEEVQTAQKTIEQFDEVAIRRELQRAQQ